MGSALSVLKVAKKDLGKDQAGPEQSSSKGVATVDSQPRWMLYQKDEGIMAIKGMKKVSKTGEVALAGDLPWMLSGRCREEGAKKGIGSGKPAAWLFVRCTAGHNLSALLGAGPALASSGKRRHPGEDAMGTKLSAEGPMCREGGQVPMDNLSLEGNLKPSTHRVYHITRGCLPLHLNR